MLNKSGESPHPKINYWSNSIVNLQGYVSEIDIDLINSSRVELKQIMWNETFRPIDHEIINNLNLQILCILRL